MSAEQKKTEIERAYSERYWTDIELIVGNDDKENFFIDGEEALEFAEAHMPFASFAPGAPQ